MIEEALRAILTGDTDVASLVSTRVYPKRLPQDPTYPAITCNRISTNGVQTVSDGHVGLTESRFQFDCWTWGEADKWDDVRTLADKVRLALDGYAGTSDGVVIQAVLREGEGDADEAIEPGTSNRGPWRRTQDFVVWFEEALS